MARFVSIAIAGLVLVASLSAYTWNQPSGLYIT